MFQGNMLPPSSGSKNKPSKEKERKQVASRAPLKHQCFIKGLHGIISQKIDLFITTTVRT
jgi:hypothetical protein